MGSERLQAAFEKTCDRSCRAIKRRSDLGQRAALAVMKDDRIALRFGQASERVGEQNRPLVQPGTLAGGWLVGREPVAPGGRTTDRGPRPAIVRVSRHA